MKDLALWVVSALMFAASVALVALLILEYLVGCGETYVDAKGVRHQHECVFLPHKKESK
jgi:hypothetical protein